MKRAEFLKDQGEASEAKMKQLKQKNDFAANEANCAYFTSPPRRWLTVISDPEKQH